MQIISDASSPSALRQAEVKKIALLHVIKVGVTMQSHKDAQLEAAQTA